LSEEPHRARGEPNPPAGDAEIAPPRPPRDRALDVVRGLCIVSMCTAHLAAGSWPYQVAHAAVWVDGAVGFVMLSGVVVGMVQRSTIDRSGLAAGQRKLLRRSAVIYAANLALCLVAFVVVALDPSRAGPYPSVEALGGGMSAVVATLTLQINPHYTSILSLYVVLLLLTTGAVGAPQRRRAPVLIGASLALYVAGRIWPAVFTFPVQPGVPGVVNWSTWQLMFAGALLIGWYWREPAVRWALTSRRMLGGRRPAGRGGCRHRLDPAARISGAAARFGRLDAQRGHARAGDDRAGVRGRVGGVPGVPVPGAGRRADGVADRPDRTAVAGLLPDPERGGDHRPQRGPLLPHRTGGGGGHPCRADRDVLLVPVPGRSRVPADRSRPADRDVAARLIAGLAATLRARNASSGFCTRL